RVGVAFGAGELRGASRGTAADAGGAGAAGAGAPLHVAAGAEDSRRAARAAVRRGLCRIDADAAGARVHARSPRRSLGPVAGAAGAGVLLVAAHAVVGAPRAPACRGTLLRRRCGRALSR